MTKTDLKIAIINSFALAITLNNTEYILKIIALIISILYTGFKLFFYIKDKFFSNGQNNNRENTDSSSED